MKKNIHSGIGLFAVCMLLLSMPAARAETQLYETGPSEESSYVRFVNASEKPITVVSSNGAAKIELSERAEGRVSRFYTVKAATKLPATIESQGRKTMIEVTGQPWEYITIVLMPGGAQVQVVKETPTDFNAMRASLSLFNLDKKCSDAIMQGGAKRATILSDVKPLSVQRRLVNPIKLTVAASCSGRTAGASIDMGQLQAGERYSVFLVPHKAGPQVFFARDAN